MDTLPITWVLTDQLRLDPANPRLNDLAVEPVAASLKRFGWRQPIVARPSGEVIAGNTRLKAARLLGMTVVPVHYFEGSELEAKAYQIADNRTGELAEWDDASLAKILEQLRAEDALEGVGFTSTDIDALVEELESGTREEIIDPGPSPPPEEPITRPGDLWYLGDHRVLCADARDVRSFDRLFEGGPVGDEGVCWKAGCLWTDPPYGVEYEGGTPERLRIVGDSADGLEALLTMSFRAASTVLAPGAALYVAHPAGPLGRVFAQTFDLLGNLRQTLIWVKDSLVLGHSDYHFKHEPILFGYARGGGKRGRGSSGWWGDNAQTSVFEIPRPKASPEHPTMKPVELIERMLRNSTGRNQIVLDPFLGSGSTLIACESLGRRCFGLEIDPRYVDVIVHRWAQATGKEPRRSAK